MRISTAMIFDAGVSSMNRQSSSLLQLQQQLSTGRRMVTPSDDPVAAAQALVVAQAQDITTQYTANQGSANSALGMSDSNLSSVTDLLNRVRQLAVEAGNGTLTASDRASIGQELRSNFDQLIGYANATDGTGQYVYSGYMGSTKPFSGTVATGVTYAGDNGQRTAQVSASRQLAISDSGSSVFQRIASGNGYFATGYTGTNTGTGVVDGGAVTNPAAWNSVTNKNLNVKFYVDATKTPPVTYYDLIDSTANVSLLTGAAPVAPTFPAAAPPTGLRVYAAGQAIAFNNLWAGPAPAAVTPADYGIQVTITGSPATNDSFTIAPSSSQSVFTTIANLINAVENTLTGTPAGGAALSNQIGFALTNLDQANNNILNVRAEIGSRLNEVTALGSANSAQNLQLQQTLSNLQDLDYAKAISDMAKNQLGLTAAQKSFQAISQLSLFTYLP
jgi:flagellar hook-associated protein 3 FlgL